MRGNKMQEGMEEKIKDRIALVHDPGDELFPGVLHPDSALFADYFNFRKASAEHVKFRKVLEKCGMQVVRVRDLILKDTLDSYSEIKAGAAVEDLRSFASQFLGICCEDSVDPSVQLAYKNEMLAKAHPEDLLNIILKRPVISLRSTPDNTGLAADYSVSPMMNLMYMRDQMIVTGKGIVIGRLFSPQRLGEGLVVEFCTRKMGFEPLIRLKGEKDSLEGGDYIKHGDMSFISNGMRTTMSSIDTLLENDLFGTKMVIVIKDDLRWQAQMHLDTYFNVLTENLVMMSQNRLAASADQAEFLKADIYIHNGSRYENIGRDISLVDYLYDVGYKIISVGMEDSMGLGVNFLHINDGEIVAVRGRSHQYRKALRDNNIKAHWVDLTHCTKGYGAVHCMAQIID